MTNPEIEQAIKNVQELKRHVMERQLFRGYSGVARIASGSVTLAVAAIMSRPSFPTEWPYYMGGWAVVFTIAVLLNGGALFARFLSRSQGLSDWNKLRPVWDIVPPLIIAGVLTLHLSLRNMQATLPGLWMTMFGLIHLCSRYNLPRYIEHVGWFYLICGIICLLFPPAFSNPWPMGVVFFLGELAGGLVIYRNREAGELK